MGTQRIVARPSGRGLTLLVVAVLLALAVSCLVGSRATSATSDSPPDIELRLPPDIVYDKIVGPDSAVTFSHTTHVALAENRCTGCHPRTFRILHPSHRTRHAAMNAGNSCGSCHDGNQAFGVRDSASCGTCHSGRIARSTTASSDRAAPTTAPARKLPKIYWFSGSNDSPGPVAFRHEKHMLGKSSCAGCHPKPFAMKAPLADMDWHESTGCGSCHDGTKSFGVDDDAKCGNCHREGGRE